MIKDSTNLTQKENPAYVPLNVTEGNGELVC
jgi:hypothetical protein